MTGKKTDMRERLMAVAKATVQARGYNALSFRELATEVGIKNPSVHHYFPTKGDLGAALARRYTEEGSAYLAELLTTSSDPGWCFDRYTQIFRAALANDNRMCLCGIMSAELDDLPPEVRVEVEAFAKANVEWIMRVLRLADATVQHPEIEDRAMAIYTAIGGAQLVARGCQDIGIYDRAIRTYQTIGLIP